VTVHFLLWHWHKGQNPGNDRIRLKTIGFRFVGKNQPVPQYRKSRCFYIFGRNKSTSLEESPDPGAAAKGQSCPWRSAESYVAEKPFPGAASAGPYSIRAENRAGRGGPGSGYHGNNVAKYLFVGKD